jgi:hypothetical protein
MTSPQKPPAEVKAEWQKRRTRHWIAFGITCAVPLIILLVDFLISTTPGERGLLERFFGFFWIGLPFVILGLLQWNRRCPACGKDPGGAFQPMWRIKNCKNCGAQVQD